MTRHLTPDERMAIINVLEYVHHSREIWAEDDPALDSMDLTDKALSENVKVLMELLEADKPFVLPLHCDRCKTKTTSRIMSMFNFNTEMTCFDCKDKEGEHPDYQQTVEAEEEKELYPNIGSKNAG